MRCLLIASLLVACVDSEPTEPALSPEEQAELDAALAAAAGKADGAGLAMYQSRYVNATVAGTTSNGDPFALIAGKHDQNFPYFDRKSKWDDMLLLVGGDAFVATGRELPELAIGTRTGTTTIKVRGNARRVNGTLAAIDLSLTFADVRFAAEQLGRRYDFLDIDVIPGMRWQPHQLRAAGGSVSVDGVARSLGAIGGELETGELTNLRAPELAQAYDYVAIATRDYSHVTFVAHALHRDGVLGKLIDWYMTSFASVTLTLDHGNRRDGNVMGVDTANLVVLAHDLVDLGPATIDRQLVRTAPDRQGRIGYGLREVFAAK